MLENVTQEIILELSKLRLNLNHLYYLEKVIEGETVKDIPVVEYQALERKSLIFEGRVTDSGKLYYEQLVQGKLQPSAEVKVKLKSITQDNLSYFDSWWGTRNKPGAYPASNHFEYRGKVFKGVQKKTVKKDECHMLFNKLVSSGEFTGAEIVEATNNHIQEAMRESLRKGENQISYIPNSERYLRERYFEPYLHVKEEADKKLHNPDDLF